ncbi:uncharacterized protein LOC111057582 [Nilaparvata lugens]|uniref:uncharacterized protein LOC111057582 n=1 Tax=Nilaparvata lugens TaxID=108931 RepID=UPI00193D599A|nr:uncharacterized protein LOC111057582 [Nilaparvata lugens]
MSVIVRLQNLPWSAVAADIRQFFAGLSIPEGGVNIVGGELGDAFIAFSTDEDARLAMQRDGGKVKDSKVKLLLSSRTEMQRETTRQQSIQMQYLQMQHLQTAPAAAGTQPAAYQMQQPTLTSNPGASAAARTFQPSMPNVQQNIYGQAQHGSQPLPAMTPMPGMQFPQMTPYSMAAPVNPLAVNPSPQLELSTPNSQMHIRNQLQLEQPVPLGQVPFQTGPHMNQPYQMPPAQVNQSPVSQAMTPVMQTPNQHIAQPQNFLPVNPQHINVPSNFQPSMQQVPPGYQAQIMNQPPPFQANAPRMTQPTQLPPANTQGNQSMPPSFPPAAGFSNSNTPPFHLNANQQGDSPALSPQISNVESAPNSRSPLLQRKPENKVNASSDNYSNKNDKTRRSRSHSSGSSGSRSHPREQRNKDKYPEKDRRKRNSRDYRQRSSKRGCSRSRDLRFSRDRRRDDDSRSGRRSDSKRSTDPKHLYKDYENPNSNLKPSVVPAVKSKPSTTASTNLENSKSPASKTAEKTESDHKSSQKSDNKYKKDSSQNNKDVSFKKFSQQSDNKCKNDLSQINKDVSSSDFTSSINNEISTRNPSSNNRTSHVGEEYKYETSPTKRKASNDDYSQDSHHHNKIERYEGGMRKRRDLDDSPARFVTDNHNRKSFDDPGNNQKPGFRNENFNRFNSEFGETNSSDYPQRPRFDYQPNCCVIIENFPIFNGPKDVIDFFHGLSPEMHIKLQRDNFGHFNSALIRFASYDDKLKGLRRNGFKLKKSEVTVRHLSDREFDEADDTVLQDVPPKDPVSSTSNYDELELFQREYYLMDFQCLCLEGSEGVDPVYDCSNVYHPDIREVFNQINPVDLFIHYGVYINRAFIQFESHAKANSARNLFAGLMIDSVAIKVFPCSDEQYAKFKEIVEKDDSNKKPKREPNRRERVRGRPMLPNPASFGTRFNEMKNFDPRMDNSFNNNDGMSEDSDFGKQIPRFNQRTLLPNPDTVLKSCCIIMQGLPLNVHYQDIVQFFSSLKIQPKLIHLMVENDAPTGDAFCEFYTEDEAALSVKRNNGRLGRHTVHVRLVSQEELDRAVGKGMKPQSPPPPHVHAFVGASPSHPPPGPPPAEFAGQPPPFPGDGPMPPIDFSGGFMARGRGGPMMMMMMRGRGRGLEGGVRGGRGGFEGGFRGGRRGFEGGRGGFEGGRGGFEGGRGGFEGGRGKFEGGRGRFEGGRGRFEGGRGGFEGGRGGFDGGRGGLEGGRGGFEGVRGGFEGGRGRFEGGRGGFEGGFRGGRGGFEGGARGFDSGIRGGRGGFEGAMSGGRGGGFEGGIRGGRGVFGRRGGLIPPHPVTADLPPSTAPNDHLNEDDLLPDSKVESFGKPGCVVAAEGIPYRADVNDIIDVFKNYKLLVAENVIRRYDDYGKVTGDARIAFESPDDAKEAIRRYDGTRMQNRTIRLHLVR